MQSVKDLVKKPDTINAVLPPNPAKTYRVEPVRLDTLDTSHHPLVKEAVEMARRWSARKISGVQNASLVLVAAPVIKPDGTRDIDRTGYGVGKTHIAKAIQWASYMIVDGEPVSPLGRFFIAQDLINMVGESPRDLHQLIPTGTDTIHGRVGGCPVVVIDDVGSEGVLQFIAKESQEDERHARYYRIINYCYERKVSVVITANMKLDTLAQHIGGRSWSRMMEMAPAGFMLDMTGVPDYRRKIGGR